jgi:predicted nucleotidyltransferase
MVIEWLSEKILYEINEEDLALEAIHLAENRLEYLAFQKIDRGMLKQQLVSTISRFDAIKSAWIYGSFSRGDDGPKSDIDLAINVDKGFSYFDLAEVQFHLELETKRKIDIGFLDSFKPHILAHVKPDLKIIYERDPS